MSLSNDNTASQSERVSEQSELILFEQILKHITVNSFEALLTCGVRNLAGFLLLTEECLHAAGVSTGIANELIGIQRKFIMRNVDFAQKNKTIVTETPQEFSSNWKELEVNANGLCVETPIPENLKIRLSTRAQNILAREKILTCERLFGLTEQALLGFDGSGKKTVDEIERLKTTICHINPNFRQTSAQKVCLHGENVCPNHARPSKSTYKYHQASEDESRYPADWSILTLTLPEVYDIEFSWNSVSIVDVQSTIGEIGLPSSDIDQLFKMAFYPDDPAEDLFVVTLQYLLQSNISEKGFSLLIHHLYLVKSNTIKHEFTFLINRLSETPIFVDLDMHFIGDVSVYNFLYQELVADHDDEKIVISYADIGNITEKSIIDHFGFTIYGLNAIKYMWGLKEQALLIEKTAMNGLPKDAFDSFEHLIDAFVQVIGKKKRDYEILKGRWGALDGRKWTLEELGHRENLTRERIRQVEKKLMEVAHKRRIIDRLYRLWLALDDILATTGGVCCVSEIAIALKKRWSWQNLPAEIPLASIVNLSLDYELIWDNPIRIIKPKHKCIECSKIGPFLSTTVESQPNGVISFEDATTLMRVFCQSQDCFAALTSVCFSRGYLYFLEDAMEEITTNGDTLYTRYAWESQFGRRRKMLETEEIFKNIGRAMHFKEALIEINKGRPPHGQLSEHVIYSRIERSPDLLLWDHGTFIHRDHVSIPFDLIAAIEAELIARLDENIPYLSVNKIFEKYRRELLPKGVQSESALYSCLRESNNPALSCPDYPFVLKSGQVERRQPVTLVLESFVSEQGGMVTLDQIRKYALEKLCLNEAVFTASYFPDIPGLLRADRGMYIQISQLGLDKDALLPIVERLNSLLNASGHVSVDRLYDEKKISCRLLGISTPILLHSLIQFYYSEQYDLSRYPQIRLPNFNPDTSRTAGVTLELSEYILDKDSPCSSVELYHHFVDKLGYKQNIVYTALYINKDILRYSKGVIIHLKTLKWTDDKQVALEMMAANHVDNRANTGKPFGLISHIYKHMIGELPEIPEHILWTSTLIGELLSRGGKWRIIGTQRDAFVQASNSYGIESLDDLIYYILDTDYDGAANIDNFVSDMREAGVLMKSLTQMMLGADGRVVVDDKVVRLARLN